MLTRVSSQTRVAILFRDLGNGSKFLNLKYEDPFSVHNL